MKKLNKKGFTIVELVIVIAVIGILAAVLVPTFSGVVTKANESKALQDAKNAYTNALVEVLADGIINDDENCTIDGFVFTFKDGKLDTVQEELEESENQKYTYTVVNGVITKATTNK